MIEISIRRLENIDEVRLLNPRRDIIEIITRGDYDNSFLGLYMGYGDEEKSGHAREFVVRIPRGVKEIIGISFNPSNAYIDRGAIALNSFWKSSYNLDTNPARYKELDKELERAGL